MIFLGYSLMFPGNPILPCAPYASASRLFHACTTPSEAIFDTSTQSFAVPTMSLAVRSASWAEIYCVHYIACLLILRDYAADLEAHFLHMRREPQL